MKCWRLMFEVPIPSPPNILKLSVCIKLSFFNILLLTILIQTCLLAPWATHETSPVISRDIQGASEDRWWEAESWLSKEKEQGHLCAQGQWEARWAARWERQWKCSAGAGHRLGAFFSHGLIWCGRCVFLAGDLLRLGSECGPPQPGHLPPAGLTIAALS